MKPMQFYTRLLCVAAIPLMLASCSDGVTVTRDAKTPTEINKERIRPQGSILTGRKEGGFTFGGNRNASALSPVNALLWRASLDTVSVIPINSVDTFSGTIISDWYPHPENPSKSVKVAVFVIGTELRSDAVRAEVYIRNRGADGRWLDSGRDPAFATRLEDLILTRARQIRASGISESTE